VAKHEIGVAPEEIVRHIALYTNSLKVYEGHYAQFWHLEPAHPIIYAGYLCPICLKNGFWLTSDGTLYSTQVQFSLDHYPPDSVGGFENVVVCKTCNNYAGTKYEAALKKKLEDMSFNGGTPGASVPAKAEISNVPGRYGSKITVRSDGIFDISFKPSHKSHTPHLDQWINTSRNDPTWKAEVTIPLADETKVSKALLKAAYLYCFAAWGYEFAYSYTGTKIRRIICGNEQYPLQNPSFWLGGATAPGTQLPVGVCYLYNNPELKCFMVNIPLIDLSTNYSNLSSILIPGPSHKDWDNLMRKGDTISDGKIITISMAHVTENLISIKMLTGYSKSWELLQSK